LLAKSLVNEAFVRSLKVLLRLRISHNSRSLESAVELERAMVRGLVAKQIRERLRPKPQLTAKFDVVILAPSVAKSYQSKNLVRNQVGKERRNAEVAGSSLLEIDVFVMGVGIQVALLHDTGHGAVPADG
jgi:hypothetical protein